MPGAERPGDWFTDGGSWGGLLDPGGFSPPARAGAPPAARHGTPPPAEGPENRGHAQQAAHMQYVQGMSQPAKSSRTPATPDAPESAAGGRAAAQRLKMRRELAAAAMELFATKGYEATTVDEIAAAAGVARRTFFRHFRSKEEAIFPDHDDTLIRAEAVLNAAPAHEHPLDTVCRGIKEVMRMYAARPEISVARYTLTREVPTLREAEIASVARYERLFTRYLLGHFDEHAHDDDANDDPLLAEVAASAVVTAHNHVLRRWLRAGGQGDVEAQLDHAFAIVRKAFGTGRSNTSRPAAATASTQGEVLVTVARVDTPLDEVMRTIERALHERS
ncbi:transcriptional regulator [Streptomyces lincolnensis]|uniref:Transcriptional regulator n=2 Tax=Streptomyces lincolnensis TaxID=1915 RepID=A0A1B1MKN8_STRLN|nr:transcriptional regulator [Streptomyces lincolnensis]AXG58016.1 transcriptional regulator [Streptomyces lincolnensis]QMV10682.1 TetR family transcriptional regulator [Streptomyces lincolnensis]